MRCDTRRLIYDRDLCVEAYRFQGVVRSFPNHFHNYYVVGLIENGERKLSCGGREQTVGRGSLLLFHPGDCHACTQQGSGALDYRALNIAPEVMMDLAQEVTGRQEMPGFAQNELSDSETVHCLRLLHNLLMAEGPGLRKEELLLELLSLLLRRYGRPFETRLPPCREEVERACAFMERNFDTHITLEQLCRRAGLSKSALLRAFTRSKGVTPYRYLENVRICAAKKLLEEGVPPAEAALRTGFSDQSHLTNRFTRLIGLTPGSYREIFSERGQRHGL